MGWVDPRFGLGCWVGLGWVLTVFSFQWFGLVGSTVPKVLYFYTNYIKSTKN